MSYYVERSLGNDIVKQKVWDNLFKPSNKEYLNKLLSGHCYGEARNKKRKINVVISRNNYRIILIGFAELKYCLNLYASSHCYFNDNAYLCMI